MSVASVAAPLGFTVNSDSPDDALEDSLYQVDLATAATTRIGTILPDSDVEGLAINSEGRLFGLDDQNSTIFEINPATGARNLSSLRTINGLTPGANDFGMTFSCSGTLYATSVGQQSLFSIDPDTGVANQIGSLSVPVVALTSQGPDDQLFAISIGDSSAAPGTERRLYQIDPATAAMTEVGVLSNNPYREAGLGFDSDGNLWMITDRRGIDGSSDNLVSQVSQVNPTTGAATLVGDTGIIGAESLAISPPGNCSIAPPPPGPGDSRIESIPTLSQSMLWLLFGLMALFGGTALRRH